MDSVHHIWCPLSSQEFQDLPDGAETTLTNGIDPEGYLRHILSVLPEWPINKVAELLPWNVDLTNK
ncbi:transposase domain-containing protein (plasmid) [Klebsiella quasipneumoniae]|nr:transposase domain-containing protein [Klebsiella quasipneumoniae]